MADLSRARPERLLVARVIKNDCEVAEYRSTMPNREVTVGRLIAPIGLMQTRLHVLSVGCGHDSALAIPAELDGILNDAAVEGVTSGNVIWDL